MATDTQEKKVRQSTEPIPPIPASPDAVAQALLNTPPKKRDEWKYLNKSKRRKTHKSA